MSKEALLTNLRNNIYCRIMPSKLHGVGVFAIRDIPQETDPFILSNNKSLKYNTIDLTKKDLKDLHPNVKKMVDDFFGDDISLPALGLNTLDISFYINHSKTPNLGIYNDDKFEYLFFKTNRVIKEGEELLINYDDYNLKK